MKEETSSSSLSGTTVGRFQILDRLGTGGMGEVFLAYDEKLDRKVALKSIRADHRLDARARARFLREARLLSQLRHPNICEIFDFVTGADADYLALEFISGTTLTDAITRGLDPKLKLRVAREIAGVLAAAHGQGIIHRDLKPDNVMLAQGEQVKVLDFGLSRSLWEGQEPVVPSRTDTERTEGQRPIAEEGRTVELSGAPPRRSGQELSPGVTVLGTVVGTPGYMSPEQARGEAVTPASDLYSLGVLLQELFTGSPPFQKGLPPEILLQKAAEGETLPVTGLDGDLTALINRLKSLAPAIRPSAVDTAERLAWIGEKPLRRRKKVLLGAAVTVLALFAVAMSILTAREKAAELAARTAEVEARKEASRANQEAEAARQVSEFLVELFKVTDPDQAKGDAVTARQLLDSGAAKIETELAGQPEVRARLMHTMGRVYWRLGLYGQAESLLRTALAIREQVLGSHHDDVARSLDVLARLLRDQGRYKEAESHHSRALAIREKAFGPGHSEVARSLSGLAILCVDQGRYVEAERLYRRALEIWGETAGPNDRDVAANLSNLGNLYRVQERFADAEPLLRRALALTEKTVGPGHPEVANGLNDVATVCNDLGKDEEAERLFTRSLATWEKTLGPDHPNVATVLNNLATLYSGKGDFARAETLLRRSLAISEKAFGPQHPDVAMGLCNLACIAARQGKKKEAIGFLRRALPGGGDTPWMAGIETDADLASLHGNQEFEQIVAEVKKRGEARQKTAEKSQPANQPR